MPASLSSSTSIIHVLVDLHLQLLIPTSALLHVYLSPYTKVEESFNTQALHDWLSLGPSRLSEFDHITFPGAVPRSFIPSILLTTLSYPILLILRLLGHIRTSADVQYHLRNILALLWSTALVFFIHRIVPHIHNPLLTSNASTVAVKKWIKRSLIIISACQFHLPFWAGRTTPNGLVMPGVLVSLALLLPRGLAYERCQLTGLSILIFLAVIYRLELLGILGGCGLYLLHSRLTVWRKDTDPHPIESFGKIAATTQIALTASAALTAGIDTFLWRSDEWMIPEISAIKFNVVEGKSAEWGTSPWHTYFTSSLPKLLSFTSPLALVGFFLCCAQLSSPIRPPKAGPAMLPRGRLSKIDNAKAAKESGSVPLAVFIVLPALHVGLLSCLAHKEWRFVAYAVPLLNVLAAVGASAFLVPSAYRGLNRLPPFIKKILPLLPLVLLTLTLAMTTVSTIASGVNYPGGEALARLHALEKDRMQQPHNVHIDILPAMTGVTLFQSVHLSRPLEGPFGLPSLLEKQGDSHWKYNKTEDLPAIREAWVEFTHLLTASPDCRLPLQEWEDQPFEPIRGSPDGPSTSEFHGLHLRFKPAKEKALALRTERTKRPMNVHLPFKLGSLQTFKMRSEEEDNVSIQGLTFQLGSSGEWGITFGLKLKDVVWICQRKTGA